MRNRLGHEVVPNILAMHKLIMDYYRDSWGAASLWALDREISYHCLLVLIYFS